MAVTENGHCTTCQVQDSKQVCGRNAQSFKSIVNSSKVKDHERYLKLDLDNNLNITPGETIVTKELWDKVHNILQYIKDYGQLGELNPTQNKINNVRVSKGNLVWTQDYNDILLALDKNNINTGTIISKELIDSLKNYIKEYEIDRFRCDVCNSSGCQVSQCCDSLSSGGGGDPCYGPGCGQTTTFYNGTVLETWTDGSFSCYGAQSARKYKENIQNYTQNAIDLINSLNIVKFNYKSDPEKNQKIGFIADDTDAQLATKNHNVMDMYNCIGILLKAVQELSQEIEELKKEK